MDLSLEHRVALMPPEQQQQILDGLDLDDLAYDWSWNGRPSQLMPLENCDKIALIVALAGRGWGKTMAGAQWIRSLDHNWQRLGRDSSHMRFALLGRTSADVRDVMLEGPSGLLNIWPPSLRDHVQWTPSRRRIELPNGAVGIAFSGEEPDQLRGPAFHVSWCDELAAFKQIRSIDGEATAWQNLRIATRLGKRPQILATTTPKRVPVVKEIMAEYRDKPGQVLLRRGRTTDNRYLSEAYLDVLLSLYGGTSLGRQELEGEILDDVVGAMTSEAVIERNRVTKIPQNIPWMRIVGVDPSVAERPHDECGILVIYISATYPVLKRHAIVVDDLSVRAAPDVWGKIVVQAAMDHNAVVVAEVNQGANLVTQMLRLSAMEMGAPVPQVRPVWSSKAKAVRSEPVGGAYAQNRVHHLNVLAEYEDQLCLPAGTLIETGRGHIGIEDVRQGDLVLTRDGWGPVAWAGETTQKSLLSIVTHEHGCVLSTMWHRIWTSNQGFVPAHLVQPSDLLVVRPSPANTVLPSPGEDGGTTGWNPDTIDMPRVSCCTGQFGQRTTDPSRKIMMSITEISSGGITPSKISPPWRGMIIGGSTSQCLVSQVGQPGHRSRSPLPAVRNGHGESRTRSSVMVAASSLSQPISGLAGVPEDATGRRAMYLSSLQRWRAASAGNRSPLGTDVRLRALNPAEGNDDTERVKVYDIKVQDGYLPEFYANGVLVHNTSWVPGESGYSPDRMDAGVHGLAAGMFPEALISGIPGSAAIHSVANQQLPLRSAVDLAAFG